MSMNRRNRHLHRKTNRKRQPSNNSAQHHHASIMSAIGGTNYLVNDDNNEETTTVTQQQKMKSISLQTLLSPLNNKLQNISSGSSRRYYLMIFVLAYIIISIGCLSLPKNKQHLPSESSQLQSQPQHSQSIEEEETQDSSFSNIRGTPPIKEEEEQTFMIKDGKDNDDMLNSLLQHDLPNLERDSDNEQVNNIIGGVSSEITQKHDVDPNFILNQFQDSDKPVLTGHETPKQLEEIMKQQHNNANDQKKEQEVQAQNVQESSQQTKSQSSPTTTTLSNEKTIAYFLPVYTCPIPYKPKDHTATSETLSEQKKEQHESISDTSFLDAAAILKYSIHRNSIHNSLSGGKYSYKMIALVHPSVQNCHDRNGFSRKDALLKLGYEVHIVDIPLESLSSISNQFLRENISNSGRRQHDAISDKKGSGGERDLIRLKAFEFVQYEIGVLVDLRTLIINPLDDVFDYFLLSKEMGVNNDEYMGEIEFAISDKKENNDNNPTITTNTSPNHHNQIQALYTRDYSSVSPGKYKVGIHPGFFIFRPSLQTYNDLVDILKKGEYDPKSGWYGKTGTFWGSMTTRGLLDYYYNHHHSSTSSSNSEAKELNRCVYNNLGASPHIRENGMKVCRNRNESIELNTCQDCRTFSLEKIKVANLSVCRDPWSCYLHDETLDSLKLCREYHHHWFLLRRELENAWEEFGGGGQFDNYEPSPKIGKERPLHFLGYCHSLGEEGQSAGSSTESYIAMKPPNSDQRGPYLDPNQVLYQFRSPANHPDGIYSENADKTYDNNQIVKPKKHFDPEEVIFQFQEGHPKRDRIQG